MMNRTKFKKKAEDALTKYQSLLKMQAHDIKLDFDESPDRDSVGSITFNDWCLGGILSLNYTGIDNDSFLQGTSMEHFLEETIIHELLHCMFEKRECDSLNQHETNINIISNIIWRYAENPLFSIDHTGKIQA